jgi:hypothetical protein
MASIFGGILHIGSSLAIGDRRHGQQPGGDQ